MDYKIYSFSNPIIHNRGNGNEFNFDSIASSSIFLEKINKEILAWHVL